MIIGRLDRWDAAAALCEVPAYLREHPHASLAARRSEVLQAVPEICEGDLLAVLAARPQLIDSWVSYVEDQRTRDGLYVRVRRTPGRGVEWTVARLDGDDVAAFSSIAPAYARLIAEIMRIPKGPE